MQENIGRPPATRDVLTIFQFLVSGLGLVMSLVAAGGLALFGFIGLASEVTVAQQAVSLFGIAWVALIAGLIAVPSLFYSAQRLFGWNPSFRLPAIRNPHRAANVSILLWPLVLVLGGLLSPTRFAWLVLPPLNILAIGLPLWWVIENARHNLPAGSRQRAWGLVNGSVFITTPGLVVLEVLVMGILFIAAVIWITLQPALVDEIQRLGEQIMASGGDPEAVLALIRPYLQNPAVIISALGLMAGLIPLLEEFVKPVALWLLYNRKMTPAEGFVAGALCGGGFALVESLMTLAGQSDQGWVALAIGRAGTSLLHVTTTAMVGWGLAVAWGSGNYMRLFLVYLSAAGLHGFWNALSLASGAGVLLEGSTGSLERFNVISVAASLALVVLAFFLLYLLLRSNRKLRHPAQPAVLTGGDFTQPVA